MSANSKWRESYTGISRMIVFSRIEKACFLRGKRILGPSWQPQEAKREVLRGANAAAMASAGRLVAEPRRMQKTQMSAIRIVQMLPMIFLLSCGKGDQQSDVSNKDQVHPVRPPSLVLVPAANGGPKELTELEEFIRACKSEEEVDSRLFRDSVRELVKSMDAGEITSLLGSLPKNPLYRNMLMRFVEALYEIDPDKLKNVVMSLGPDTENVNAFWTLGEITAKASVPEWIFDVQSKTFQDTYFSFYFKSSIENDPEAAAEKLIRIIPRGVDVHQVDLALAQLAEIGKTDLAFKVMGNVPEFSDKPPPHVFMTTWGRAEPEQALNFIRKHGGSADYEPRLTEGILAQWALKDSIAASKFVASEMDGSEYSTELASSMARAMYHVNPEDGLPWALAVKDPQKRTDDIMTLLNAIKTDSPERGQRALENLKGSLSKEEFSILNEKYHTP
jgi:hypothetical protein